MTRKQLEDLGLTKEQADSVMKINGDDIENAKGTASTEIKNLQTEVEGLKTQVGDRDKQLETLKASAGDNADLKKKIEDLQTENATAKATHESELNQLKIDFAVEKALTGAKAKNITAVKALLDLKDAKFDKEGKEWYFEGGIKTAAGKCRIVPIHERIRPFVKALVDEGNKYLFTYQGKKFSQANYYKCWGEVMEKIGADKTPHEARHTFETLLDNAKGNRKCIDMLMGHKSKDVGNRVYNHKTIQQLRETIALLK